MTLLILELHDLSLPAYAPNIKVVAALLNLWPQLVSHYALETHGEEIARRIEEFLFKERD